MPVEKSDIEEKLHQHSPDTGFERFAKCFRNMGVVESFRRGRGDNILVVETSERGMNVTPVRQKGHSFHVQDTGHNGDSGTIRHVLEYLPDD